MPKKHCANGTTSVFKVEMSFFTKKMATKFADMIFIV